MEWIERLNSTVNYIEEHILDGINMKSLQRLRAVQHIIFRECFRIWQKYHCLNTYAEGGCLWRRLTCKVETKK